MNSFRKLSILALLLLSFSLVEAQQWPKNSEIYDFDIGDEFLIEGKYAFAPDGWGFENYKIIDRWTDSSNNVYYKRQVKGKNIKIELNSFRRTITYYDWLDTLIISNYSDSVRISLSPVGDSVVFSSISSIGNTVGNKKVYGFLASHNQFPWNSIHSYIDLEYIAGCGGPYYTYDHFGNSHSVDYLYLLRAYKKDSVVLGAFPDWTTWPVGLGNKLELDKTRVYPTVSSGIFYLESTASLEEIMVYDQQGKLLYAKDNPGTHLDLSSLSSGIYIVKIQTKADTEFSRIIIRK